MSECIYCHSYVQVILFYSCSVIRATLDLEEIGFRLSEEYKLPLSANFNKRLEYEFHSCGYNNLIEIITALRTACGHLVKVSAWV